MALLKSTGLKLFHLNSNDKIQEIGRLEQHILQKQSKIENITRKINRKTSKKNEATNAMAATYDSLWEKKNRHNELSEQRLQSKNKTNNSTELKQLEMDINHLSQTLNELNPQAKLLTYENELQELKTTLSTTKTELHILQTELDDINQQLLLSQRFMAS